MSTVEILAAVAPPPDRVIPLPTDAPPIAANTHLAQPPDAGNPTPVPQASLDNAVGEGSSLTEAAARVRKVTQAAYGMVTSLLGGETLTPDASVKQILEKIKAKNPARSFQDTDLEHEIILALEEAKILSQEKPLLPTARESTLPVESIDEISARIKTAWTGDGKSRGAVQLIISAAEGNIWDESQENYYGVAGRLKYIDVVIGEAKEAVQKKIDQAVRRADKIRVNQGQMPMEGEELTKFIIKYKKVHQEELAGIVNKYYEFDRKSGTYTLKIGLDKNPLDSSRFEKISTFSNVPDAMEALRDLAGQTDTDNKPTPEAQEAKKILSTLEKYLNAEGNGFEPLTDVEKAGREVVGVTYKLVDALLEPFGENLTYEDVVVKVDGKEVKKHRLNLDVLSKIDPTCRTGEFGELGGRISRLSVLLNQYETVDIKEHPDAKTYLAAMIYEEASHKSLSNFISQSHPTLAKEFATLSENNRKILQDYRDKLLLKVKEAIYPYYYPGEPLDPKKQNAITLAGENLFRDLYFAYFCEGDDKVGVDSTTRALVLDKALQAVLDRGRIAGEISEHDIKAVKFLAGSRKAGVILKDELGFDPDRLKEQPITAYAKRVIESIDNKRPDDKKMTEEEKKGYRAVFQELKDLAEEAGEGSKLGGIMKFIGMLALILGPSVFKMFDEGAETGQEPQPRG